MSEVFLCDTSDSQEIVDCLMKEEAADLDFWGLLSGAFTIPTLDGDIIPNVPKQAFEQGLGKDKDFISGATKHDFGGFLILNPMAAPSLGDKNNLAGTLESTENFVRTTMGFAENTEELVELAYEKYPDMRSEDNLTRTQATTAFSTDRLFGAPAHMEAVLHARYACSTAQSSLIVTILHTNICYLAI